MLTAMPLLCLCGDLGNEMEPHFLQTGGLCATKPLCFVRLMTKFDLGGTCVLSEIIHGILKPVHVQLGTEVSQVWNLIGISAGLTFLLWGTY